MSARIRFMVVGALVFGIGAFAAYRVTTHRTACLAAGGSYDVASLTCTAKGRPIILQRGILRG